MRLRIRNFESGLWIAGGREDAPTDGNGPITLRKADGMNAVKTITLRSRPGSTLIQSGQNAHSLFRFGGVRYAGIGTTFINADTGAVLKTGLSGNRLSFAKMPAQLGGPDYLFVADGSSPFKVDVSGNVSKWGIDAPPDQMTGVTAATKTRVIDSFNTSAAGYTLTQNLVRVAKADDATLPGSDLQLSFAGANHWRLHKALTIDLSTYADTSVSLPTDAIAITLEQTGTGFANFGLRFRFYLDATAVTDYYEAIVSLVADPKFSYDFSFPMALGDIETLEIPKSVFRRVGTNGLSWESVGQVEIRGQAMSLSAADYGNAVGSATSFGALMFLQNWQLQGGYPLKGSYQYAVTYKNSSTGSRSNSNPNYIVVLDVDRQPVTNGNLPISSDPQVDTREIWRSVGVPRGTAFSNTLFLLTTIYDNTTTSYVDSSIADTPVPYTINVWKAAFAAPLGFFVDGGNGYYFKATVAGTTGGTLPAWNVPNSGEFTANYPYVANNTIYPRHNNANKALFKVTGVAGNRTSGQSEPNWDSVVVGGTISSGGITLTNQGTLTTVDNTATWTLQGVNSLETLQGTQLPLDNAPPPLTTLRCVGPYQGMMFSATPFVTDDTGFCAHVNYSPPGRPESFSGFIAISDPDDPIQNIVIFNGNLFAITRQHLVFVRVVGTEEQPGLTLVELDFNVMEGAPGTIYPFSIAECNQFIAYQAMEGLMKFDGATAIEFGMAALGPIFRGESAENLVAMQIATSTYHDGEYICSDGANQSLAIDIYSGRWRSLGVALNAVYTEQDTTSLLTTLAGNIVLMEEPGTLSDAGTPIAIDWQSASFRLATSQQAIIQRMYIDINPNGATLTPTLILDNASIPLPPLVGTGRKNPPYEWTLGLSGQMLAVRLTGNVSDGIIELFGIEFDVEAGMA